PSLEYWITRFRGYDNLGHAFAFPRRENARVLQIIRPDKGVGNAGHPMHPQPRVQNVESTRVSHHESTGKPGIPARDGVNGCFVLSPEIGFLVSVACEVASTDLAPASRRQDHTTLPSALAPFVTGTTSVHRIPPRVS
ncbi:MAG TPA: hypothetical protein VN926_06805, partial [Bradyrhizobium sp.]|nr:hypothetical protein [Bradyrhizobium sp.]